MLWVGFERTKWVELPNSHVVQHFKRVTPPEHFDRLINCTNINVFPYRLVYGTTWSDRYESAISAGWKDIADACHVHVLEKEQLDAAIQDLLRFCEAEEPKGTAIMNANTPEGHNQNS